MTPLPDDMAIARSLMVEAQVRPNQVNDARVINAMRRLPREDFAPAGGKPYADADIHLGEGRFLLAPMLSARLAQVVLADNPARVLVVGAGAGYLAAVLAAAGAAVTALESDARLETGGLLKHAPAVPQVSGPLAAGSAAGGPYEAILIEGAVLAIPEGFAAQLAPGGQVVTVLAESRARAGLGWVVKARPSGGKFALVKLFDCTARIIPAFLPAPEFVF